MEPFGRGRRVGFQRLEVKPRNIGSAGKFNADLGFLFLHFAVVLSQLLSRVAGPDAYDGIAAGVVTDRAAEHLGPDHPLSKAVDFPFKGMSDDQLKKILGAFASGERMAHQNLLAPLPHCFDLLRREQIRLTKPRWTASQHRVCRFLLIPYYTTAKNRSEEHTSELQSRQYLV